MDTCSARAVSEELGVSAPTIHRLATQLGLGASRSRGAHRRFNAEDVQRMTDEIGAVPSRPAGLSREHTLALAALARHPRGVSSARVIARVAGISPSTASRALAQLVHQRLALREPRRVIDPAPRDIDLWFANISHEDWPGIAPVLGRVRLPRRLRPRATRLPRTLWYLFWNGDPRRLDPIADAGYIASRLLLSNDPGAFAWAADNLPPEALAGVAKLRGASERQRAMATNLAAAAS